MRRCGWLREESPRGEIPVWTRRDLTIFECPKSFVTGDSLVFIERYGIWKRFGGQSIEMLSARDVEAFLILEAEVEGEARNIAREGSRSH